MENQLTHEASAFINFRDYRFQDPRSHGFRWVDIKHLRLPAESVGGWELLAALIGHEQFRDDYAGGGVLAEGSRHGPYWLRLITPDVYKAVSREESAHVLWGWVNQFGDIPAELGADLQHEVFDRLAAADHIYYLSGLGDEAIHDWGRVHEDFHEFVLIDRSAGRITLLVAADD
ncbi:hypothetical protein OOK13_41600 [Streptomyces sp. NBC_00378]|uniref:hypothetical protein n=1 Tax=unclassified Streptomyces TaxID=2593676 RepID=UPI0022538139|nr:MULTISPECIES: hypothetical protein [unclassified Streptomyces]MCX5114834.1 hypothetical protein [Streptomyces sp. NBC_00378]